ncbi:uncharacterized protein [Bactrocera oleae]|uniref:uncharacterized protein isoform X1 n=1 Tax=Bactrocera oleae TaxID=104688 RepID=UPI00387E6991
MPVMSANITTVGTTSATTIATHLQNVTVSKSFDPFNNQTIPFYNNNSTSAIGFNYSNTTPCCQNQFPTDPTIITFGDYWYWNEIFFLYIMVLLLICIGVAYAIRARTTCLAAQKQRARLRAQSSGNASPPADGSCTENAAPRCDNPPTYESAMANYLDAKQQLREMEEGALAGANAMTASTTTIETCISNVGQSHTDLRTTINDAAPTGSESPRQPLQ